MADQKILEEINRKLEMIVQILSYQLVSGKTVTHGAPILRRLGLNPNEIASVFATTKKTVEVRLSEAKKVKKS